MIAIFQVRKLGHREVVLFWDLDWDPDCIARRGTEEAGSPEPESIRKVLFVLIALGLIFLFFFWGGEGLCLIPALAAFIVKNLRL